MNFLRKSELGQFCNSPNCSKLLGKLILLKLFRVQYWKLGNSKCYIFERTISEITHFCSLVNFEFFQMRFKNCSYISGASLERVRRVRPHPVKLGSGCAAPVLRTELTTQFRAKFPIRKVLEPSFLFVNRFVNTKPKYQYVMLTLAKFQYKMC